MLASATAVVTAFFYSLRHQTGLHITANECCRYWSKSINLALCYRGFASNSKISSAFQAGRAAFYCCAYDVVTDWRAFDEASFNWFKTLLNHDLPSHVAEIAFKLYEQDKSGKLQNDGLSRGIIALELVTRLIGSYEFIQSRFDFKRLGIIMQIVDDVLDYENDRLGGELNCLITSSTYQRNEYIRELLNFDLEKFRQVFPYGTVLYQVIRYSKGKVKSMFHYDCTTPPMQLAN